MPLINKSTKLEATYQSRTLTVPHPEHRSNLDIQHKQVLVMWQADWRVDVVYLASSTHSHCSGTEIFHYPLTA